MVRIRKIAALAVTIVALGLSFVIAAQQTRVENTPGAITNDVLRRAGTEYVAFEGGMGRAATVTGPNNAKVDGAPMMFVFTLDGKAELPEPAPPAAPALPAAADQRGPAPEQQN